MNGFLWEKGRDEWMCAEGWIWQVVLWRLRRLVVIFFLWAFEGLLSAGGVSEGLVGEVLDRGREYFLHIFQYTTLAVLLWGRGTSTFARAGITFGNKAILF
jgi:hypothetical protein